MRSWGARVARKRRSPRSALPVAQALSHGSGRSRTGIEAEFEMTDRSALSFVRVAQLYGDKSEIISDLPPTVLYALAAPSTPEEVREKVEKDVADGKQVTVAEVRRPRGSTITSRILRASGTIPSLSAVISGFFIAPCSWGMMNGAAVHPC